MLFDGIVLAVVLVSIGFIVLKGINLNLTINVNYKYPEVPTQEVEDIYDADGDNKDEIKDSLDNIFKDLNNFMLDREDEPDGSGER